MDGRYYRKELDSQTFPTCKSWETLIQRQFNVISAWWPENAGGHIILENTFTQ